MRFKESADSFVARASTPLLPETLQFLKMRDSAARCEHRSQSGSHWSSWDSDIGTLIRGEWCSAPPS